MASYDTIPTPAVEDGPKPKTSLKRVLAVSAIASFVLGALAATSLRSAPASAATQTALIDGGAGKQYIIDDCYGTQRCRGDQFSDECWYDLHVEYLKEDLSTGLYGGWYCVGTWWSGDSQIDKFRRVEWSDDGPGIVQFDPDCYHTSSDPKDWKTGCHPYDAADFSSTDCPAAYDQNYGQWRCFSEDDFVASSLSAWDLAYQTKRAAEAYYPDDYSMDLYGSNGYFNIDEDYANKHPNKKHQYFYWSYATDDQEDPVYYEGMPEGDHWKLWRANEDTGGYYNVYKECDDVSTCWLKYICIQDGTDDTAWGDC